jgi:TolA-binding protein
MLYDKLWDIAVRADWRSMSLEYEALAAGGFAVATVLIWNRIRMRKRIRRIETQLEKMQKEISLLQMQESRRLMTELNMKSTEKIEPPGTARDRRVDTVVTGKTD